MRVHPQIRLRVKAGEKMEVASMKIPMVDLPLGATEDRVCGTIDIERALSEGARTCAALCVCPRLHTCTHAQRAVLVLDLVFWRVGGRATPPRSRPQLAGPSLLCAWTLPCAGVKAFEPGLLAKANRGILYVDEVNLLDDHLVGGARPAHCCPHSGAASCPPRCQQRGAVMRLVPPWASHCLSQ